MTYNKTVLLTGSDGFTGIHLLKSLEREKFNIFSLKSDLLDYDSICEEIKEIEPDYVIHLAAISFSNDKDSSLIYRTNILGTENLLNALSKHNKNLKKIILASSASIYGNQNSSPLKESSEIFPINHYGISKFGMEQISQNYGNLPIIIARPFNYTGKLQSNRFLIPKIVNAFKNKEKYIELGNIDVFREFNDVRDIVEIYKKLLTHDHLLDKVNICSGQTHSISDVIDIIENVSKYKIKVLQNPDFIRKNEIITLCGDPSKMQSELNYKFQYNIEDTITWMLA